MPLKTFFSISFLLLLQLSLISQIKIQSQFGGANFLGMSINIQKDYIKNDKSFNYSAGLGILLPGWDKPTNIINVSVGYSYKKLGLNIELSKFFISPNYKIRNQYITPFIDFLAYPSLSYNIDLYKNIFIKISAGTYFAYSFDRYTKTIIFEGDIIPGAGLTIGYKLNYLKRDC